MFKKKIKKIKIYLLLASLQTCLNQELNDKDVWWRNHKIYKKGRLWKSKLTGESQLASVGREECWPEISWFSSFHCKSPPPNPPPEKLKSNRSQHWHSGNWLATGFPGKLIHQINKQKYWFIVFADYHEANTLQSISNY